GRLHIAAGVPEAAIGLLQRGLARAQAIGSRAMQRDLHAALSDAQAASGYHRRALEHLRTAANLRNELLDTQTHAQINVLNTSYEKQLREREIEALRAENSLAQATLERQTWLRRAYVGGTVAAFVVILFIFARRAHARELAIEREGKARLQARVDERTAELKAANDHLTQTLENPSATQEQLVEAEKMASMGALVAGVAHQINTPLGVAITAASQLQDNTRRLRSAGSADDREQRLEATLERSEQFCDLLNQNLERAAGLVRSFKRVAADQTKVARREFDVLETLEPVLKSFRGQAQSSGHELILENELQPGTRITSYPAAFRQILTNLLDNALMHGLADRQNGEVRVSLGWSGDGQLQLTIADNGAGIDEETRAHLFEPFYTTRQDRGRTGLGLHGVFNLVTRLLRGTISCDARPGEGAVFTIRIPSVE
ncbi:MAG: HAMP domain-containing sensor histidine kinase, partial [Candidatus Competibacterales bacterium]|nr:HAMP domain-containing sensor histidine kinase [Candidatus Competibacterales bacterium]